MRRVLGLMSIVLMLAAAASADIVHLKNGETREGRIIERSDDAIVLEIRAGSAVARVTLRTDDIDRIEKKKTETELVEAEYRKRLRKLDGGDADAVVTFAKWCVGRKMFDRAEKLLNDLAAAGDAQFIRGKLALAEIDVDRGRYRTATEHLKAITDKHPENNEAAALLAKVTAAEERSLEMLLVDAKTLYDRGKYAQALRKVEAFHARATPERTVKLIKASPFDGVRGFEDFVAEARLRLDCPYCKGGLTVCPKCKGKVDLEKGLCLACAGQGQVVCARCDGTGVKLSSVPSWQLQAVVRALGRRAASDTAQLARIAETLAGTPEEDKILAAVARATLVTSRAVRWLDELEKIGKKNRGLVERDVALERDAVVLQFRDICVKLGDVHTTRAKRTWQAIAAAGVGMLAQDNTLRTTRDDLLLAGFFYDRARLEKKARHTPEVQVKADAARALLAKVQEAVTHNERMLRAYKIARFNYDRGKLDIALKALVALVENGSKEDLLWLSAKIAREIGGPLAQVMAHCRFEVGKDDGKFGKTTPYERPEFIKKLLREADAMANVAHGDYERMLGFLDHGRRNDVPTSMVRRTRENAEDARRWYRAVFDVPYPIASRKRKEIDDQIEYMGDIVSRCRRWYRGSGLPGTGPRVTP